MKLGQWETDPIACETFISKEGLAQEYRLRELRF